MQPLLKAKLSCAGSEREETFQTKIEGMDGTNYVWHG